MNSQVLFEAACLVKIKEQSIIYWKRCRLLELAHFIPRTPFGVINVARLERRYQLTCV